MKLTKRVQRTISRILVIVMLLSTILSSTSAFAEDTSLPTIVSAEAYNGKISLKFDENEEVPSKENFMATYNNALTEELNTPIIFTGGSIAGNALTLEFDTLYAAAEDQDITVNLSYNSEPLNLDLSFIIPGDTSLLEDPLVIHPSNLLKDSSFEEYNTLPLGNAQTDKTGKWYGWTSSMSLDTNSDNARTGNNSILFNGGGDTSLEQDIADADFIKGKEYTATVWLKPVSTSSNASIIPGVKWYDATTNEVKTTMALTPEGEYTKYTYNFNYAGGNDNNRARLYVWIESLSGNSSCVYADDYTCIASDTVIEQVKVKNGTVELSLFDAIQTTPALEDFTISYRSNSGASVSVTPTELTKTEDKSYKLSFDPIAQTGQDQTISLSVAYKDQDAFEKTFFIEANEDYVTSATLESVSAVSGTVTALLSVDPSRTPTQENFTVEYKIGDVSFEPLNITGYQYDSDKHLATFTHKALVTAQEVTVTIRVTYGGTSETASYLQEKTANNIYYVDVSGDDDKDGLSPETAWQTLAKVNEQTFEPGDHILFKCGGVWLGTLAPKGSGTQEAPIVISSYGDGALPKLQPSEADEKTLENWYVANTNTPNIRYNDQIRLENVSHYEICDLELHDPNYEANMPSNANDSGNGSSQCYRRGISVYTDTEDVRGFYFHDLVIHGYRGTNSNRGKSSGGIIFTVNTNSTSTSQPTYAIHDITVTDCVMYDLGRSGFNFTSPFTTREDEGNDTWGSYAYKGYGTWTPCENVYIANNIIHDIDGDGILIDGCKDVVVENNLVYRTHLRSQMAVGMFAWNSDNVVMQFNEVYETSPSDATSNKYDSQGIEIDALNRDVYVQYNYTHDNYGGVFMWCTTNDELRGYRGIYRYNISQNDGNAYGIIDWRPNHYDSLAYNNTVYMTNTSGYFMHRANSEVAYGTQFYNNLFYYVGSGMQLSDTSSGDCVLLSSQIDWSNNYFYNMPDITHSMLGGEEKNNIITTEDPMLADPGKGGKGTLSPALDTLNGYKLIEGSPLIGEGAPITVYDKNGENVDLFDDSFFNGGRDFFGVSVDATSIDIGAAQYEDLGDFLIVPSSGNCYLGETLQLELETKELGTSLNAEDFTWSLDGMYASGTEISQSGLLTVAFTETASSITVYATDKSDSDNIAKGTYTVDNPVSVQPVENLYKGGDTTFTALYKDSPADAGDYVWSVSGAAKADTKFISDGVLHVAGDETASALSITLTRKANGIKATISVSTIKDALAIVAPAEVTIAKTQQLSVTCFGEEMDPSLVTWSLEGASADTAVSNNGLLKIGASEAAKEIIVKAVAKDDPLKTATTKIKVSQGGSNVSLGAEILAAAGAGNTGEQDYNLFDGNYGTKWCHSGSTTWLAFDIGEQVEVNRWLVYNANSAAEGQAYNTVDYALEYLDTSKMSEADALSLLKGYGSSHALANNDLWIQADRVQDNTEDITEQTFEPVTSRIFRLRVYDTQSQTTNRAVRIYELELYSKEVISEEEFLVMTNPEIFSGMVTADKESAIAGEEVTVTVVPDSDYRLVDGSLKVNDVEIQNNKFVMPSENVVITAVFEETTDKSELKELYEEYKELKGDGYTTESWTAFQAALTAAEKVLKDEKATQEEVNAAKEALQKAYDKLEKAADKGELEKLYEEYKELKGDRYTAESWKIFEDALKDAYDVLEADDQTQDEVNAATDALKTAYAGLEEVDVITYTVNGLASTGGAVAAETMVAEGDDAQITVKADEGSKLVAVLIDGVTADISTIKDDLFTIENVQKDMMLVALFVTDQTDFAAKYTDVPESWYYDAVDMLTGLGIVEGKTNTTYEPKTNVTRAEFTKLLFELSETLGIDVAQIDSIPFTDMPVKNYWAEGYIGWAYENGLVKGYNSSRFGPDDSISRQDMAVMLQRFFEEYMGYELSGDKAIDFRDKAKIGDYAENAVDYVVRTGLMEGFDVGTFGPEEGTQRSQIAQVLYNYLIYAS